MKTIKLMAALAVPAMFAACTNEEILVDAPLANQEIVGAELVGTNISINAGLGGVESRYNGNWELTDQLGLGWIVNTGSTTPQDPAKEPNKDELYANNMFAKEDVNGAFVTDGNVYKGWNFAYYPYERMDMVETKKVTINPVQTTLWEAAGGARFDGRFAISARHFLTSDDVDPETNQLKQEKEFAVQWANNEIAVHLVPTGSFVDSKYLNNLAIQKVTLSETGKDANSKTFAPYAATATLIARNVPSVVNKDGQNVYLKATKDKVVDAEKTKENLLAKLPTYLVGDYASSITTEITADIKTGQGGTARIFTLPYVVKNQVKDLNITPKFKVEVEGGYFTIAKVAKAEEGSYDEENNEQLDALIDAYATEGKFSLAENIGRTQQVTLNLQEKNFTPDFSSIETYKEWQQCVNIVNALGFTKDQTFTITGDIEVTGTSISLPKNCKVIVKARQNGKLNIKKTLKSWPAAEKMDVSNVTVEFNAPNTISKIVAKNIVNNSELTIAEGTAAEKNSVIVNDNNGTIIVNKYAEVNNVDNEDGRIEIIYGGIANTTVEGVIFYDVKGTEPAYKINNLMTDGNVNTFVVDEGVTFDLNNITNSGSLSDEYDPQTGVNEPINADLMADMTIEMTGGQVIGAKNGVQSNVAAIEVLSGTTNKTTDVKASEINVVAGTLTMDATTYKVGTETKKYELDMKAATEVTVAKEATLVANATTHVNILTNAGLVKANADYIFHFNSGTNIGTLTGEVEECNCPVDDTAEVAAVKSTWTALNAVLKYTTYNAVIEKIASFKDEDWAKTGEEAGIGVKFVRALNAWLVAEGYDKISESATSTFTKMHFQAFETATGYSFGLN